MNSGLGATEKAMPAKIDENIVLVLFFDKNKRENTNYDAHKIVHVKKSQKYLAIMVFDFFSSDLILDFYIYFI